MEQVILFVPTANRFHKLSRLIRYLSQFDNEVTEQFRLIVADGSNEFHARLNSRALAMAPMSVDYKAYDPEYPFLDRLHDAYQELPDGCPVMVVGDDDFPILETLLELRRELYENRNNIHLTQCGQYLNLYEFPSEGRLGRFYFDISYQLCRLKNLGSGSALRRLFAHRHIYSNGAPSVSYSLMWTEALKEYTAQFSSRYLASDSESLFIANCLGKGNVSFSPKPFLIRDYSGYIDYEVWPGRQDPEHYYSEEGAEAVQGVVQEKIVGELGGDAELARYFSEIYLPYRDKAMVEDEKQEHLELKWMSLLNNIQLMKSNPLDVDFFERYFDVKCHVTNAMVYALDGYYKDWILDLRQRLTEGKIPQARFNGLVERIMSAEAG